MFSISVLLLGSRCLVGNTGCSGRHRGKPFKFNIVSAHAAYPVGLVLQRIKRLVGFLEQCFETAFDAHRIFEIGYFLGVLLFLIAIVRKTGMKIIANVSIFVRRPVQQFAEFIALLLECLLEFFSLLIVHWIGSMFSPIVYQTSQYLSRKKKGGPGVAPYRKYVAILALDFLNIEGF